LTRRAFRDDVAQLVFQQLAKQLVREKQVKLARKYLILGRVQGVGFRFFAEHWANQLGLCGYVKNCWDGTVEAYAIGNAAALEEFKSRLTEGPRSARVDSIQESEEQLNNRYKRFVVESDW